MKNQEGVKAFFVTDAKTMGNRQSANHHVIFGNDKHLRSIRSAKRGLRFAPSTVMAKFNRSHGTNRLLAQIRPALSYLLSLSLALSPVYGIPVAQAAPRASHPPHIAQTESAPTVQPTPAPTPPAPLVDSQPSDEASQLLTDIKALVDRAAYPNVPRKGQTGLPTDSEISQIQTRVNALRSYYQQHLAERILSLGNDTDEAMMAGEINTFYSVVQKLEGLKILLHQPVQPENWDKEYGLDVNLASFSQLQFMANMSLMARNFVSLPGTPLDFDRILNLMGQARAVKANVIGEAGQWHLSLRLNKEFAEGYDYLSLVLNPNTRNVVKYAILWSAQRLYDDWGQVQIMLKRPITDLPEPSQNMRNEFVSMRIKRELALEIAETQAFKVQKVLVLKAILDAMDKSFKENRRPDLDPQFLRDLNKTAALEKYGANFNAEMDDVHHAEFLSLLSLINLVDVTNWKENGGFIVNEFTRLALRWIFLNNPSAEREITTADKLRIEQAIDERAKALGTQLLADGSLNKNIMRALAGTGNSQILEKSRRNFQATFEAGAKRMRDFASRTINLAYLATAQQAEFNLLKPSTFVNGAFEKIKKAKTYRLGFLTYESMLYTYMQGFAFRPALPQTLDLKTAFQAVDGGNATWNPQSLAGKVDARYLNALNADKEARLKDLKDLVKIGKLLKFDNYEVFQRSPHHKLHGVQAPASPKSLGVKTNIFESLIGSERTAYLSAMQDDLINHSPILGAITSDGFFGFNSKMMWEDLVDPNLSEASKVKLVDDQLPKIWQQIAVNNTTLDKFLIQTNSGNETTIAGVDQELRTLMTRTMGIKESLNSFGGFDKYYEEIRNQLMLPGFVEREWQNFSSWNTMATLALLGYYALQFAGANRPVLGRASDLISKWLAPVFGVDLASFNLIMLASAGVQVSEIVASWYNESARAGTLQNFFNCGAAAPCVALYSDMRDQQALASAARNKFISMGILLAVLAGGIYATSKALNWVTSYNFKGRVASLAPEADKLGLTETVAKLQTRVAAGEHLEFKERNFLASSNLRKMSQEAIDNVAAKTINSLEREAAAAVIGEAREVIEKQVWQEVNYWNRMNLRFAEAADRLGLNSSAADWKDLNDLATAWVRLIELRDAHKISTFEYNDLLQSIKNMYKAVAPVYNEAQTNALARGFIERVWSERGVSTKTVEIRLAEYERLKTGEFFKAMENMMSDQALVSRNGAGAQGGTSSGAVDRLLAQISQALGKDPERARARIESIISTFRRQKGKE